MATGNPYSSFANPNSFLGQPILPKVGRTAAGMMTPQVGAPPPMPAGVAPIPQFAGFNPISALASLNPFRSGPLIRTDYGEPPAERPEWRDPSQQWDARRPQPPAIVSRPVTPMPVAPSFLTPSEQGFYNYSRLSPSSRGVVSAVRQPAGIREGVMGTTIPQEPSTEQRISDSRFASAAQLGRLPMAPMTAGLGGLTERVGVRTAYGMVYPTSGQEEAAKRLAQMPKMGARLESLRQQAGNPKWLKTAVEYVRGGGENMKLALEGLTQREKIRVMRERGRYLAQERASKQRSGEAVV